MGRKKRKYQHYGLTVYELDDGTEWAVGDDTDKSRDAKGRTRVDRAARRAVIDDLWSFRSEFLADFLVAHVKHFGHVQSGHVVDAIKPIQAKLCEGAQPIIRALLGRSLSKFIDHAIETDGRGAQLASYDDDEERRSDDVPGLPKGKIAFRLN